MKKKLSIIVLSIFLACSFAFAQEVHQWDAKNYSQNSDSQRKTSIRLLEKLDIRSGETVLDIGSGTGAITASVAANLNPNSMIIGADLSPNMVTFAKQNFPQSEYPNLEFQIADACSLNYKNQFDVVYSLTTLQWAQDHDQVLKGIYKSLKDGGRVGIEMPMGMPVGMERAANETMKLPRWSSYFKDFKTGFNFVSIADYKKLLKKNNFKITELEKHIQYDTYDSLQIFKAFISQWFPYLRVIPKPLKSEFMDDFLTLYTKYDSGLLDEDNKVHFSAYHLAVIARK